MLQVVIESIESSGQYLHTSALPLEHLHPDAAMHEVNLAAEKSTFVLLMHSSVSATTTEHLTGGCVVQLFHKVYCMMTYSSDTVWG